jgi:hypothetical protein
LSTDVEEEEIDGVARSEFVIKMEVVGRLSSNLLVTLGQTVARACLVFSRRSWYPMELVSRELVCALMSMREYRGQYCYRYRPVVKVIQIGRIVRTK